MGRAAKVKKKGKAVCLPLSVAKVWWLVLLFTFVKLLLLANFSNTLEEKIKEGFARMGHVLRRSVFPKG